MLLFGMGVSMLHITAGTFYLRRRPPPLRHRAQQLNAGTRVTFLQTALTSTFTPSAPTAAASER